MNDCFRENIPTFSAPELSQTIRRHRVAGLLFLFLFCAATVLFSQQLHFQHYNIQDGFVHSGTGSREVIFQDREGFMWFSTHHGISRFDGVEFKNFRYDAQNPNSLGDNVTAGIVEADNGRIWVITLDAGLYIFDPLTETFQAGAGEAVAACSLHLNTINKDQDGNIWIGTRFDEFCRWVKESGRFEKVGDLDGGHHFYQQQDGTAWLGGYDGLYKILPDDTPRLIPIPNIPDDWRYKVVQDMTELPSGNFLLTSSFEGFWEFDPATESYNDLTSTFKFENSKVPFSFLPDEDGKIWIGGNGELWHWNPKDTSATVYLHKEENPYSPPATMIPCMAYDRSGSLWVITRGDGIAVAHDLDNSFQVIAEMPLQQMLQLNSNQMILWADDGAYNYAPQSEALSPTKLPIGKVQGVIPSLTKYSGDELLIYEGKGGNSILYNLKTGAIKLLPEARYPLRVAGGRIWAAFFYLDRQTNEWINALPEFERNIPGFEADFVNFVDILYDEESSMWLATTKGLYHYNLKTKQGKSYQHDTTAPHSLPSSVCQPMFPGSERRIYVPTTNGLGVYDPINDRFDNYNYKNGLLHDHVYTVVEDDEGNPWIGTVLGLQKLELATGTFTNFDVYDGLPGLEIDHGYRDLQGWLYFLTDNQVFRFHPDSLPVRDYSAPVYLMDFFLNHEAVTVGATDSLLQKMLRYTPSITLPYKKNDFGFSFTMPVFYKPEATTYYYRLLPYQSDWKAAGKNREIHYTNIDPGTYSFEVKAKTATGFWSTQEATVAITVLPPWYATLWARTLVVLLLVSAIYFFYRQRLSRALEQAEGRRLQDLNRLKTRLYTNITHEFRTPLTVITGIANTIRGHSEEKELIQRNSTNLLRLINQMLDLSKLDSGMLKMEMIQADIISYLNYLTESFFSMAAEKQIRLSFHTEVEKLVMDFDEEKMQHIMYNLLSNAIKFTPKGGKVILQVKQLKHQEQDWLQLKISDTGQGISSENVRHIFNRFYQIEDSNTESTYSGTGIGLALTKELVELTGGQITVESEVGVGTDFMIVLPVKRARETTKKAIDIHWSSDKTTPPSPGESFKESWKWQLPIQNKETPTLLIIEDNRDVISYIERLLRKDFEIAVAYDGQEGIEKAFELIPDMIISDVMMPEKNGYEVCQTLKKDSRSSHIPIILLTAKATTEDRMEGLRGGADAYLIKPFHKEELFIRLKQLLLLRESLRKRYTSKGFLLQQNTTALASSTPSMEDAFLQTLSQVVQDRLNDAELSVDDLCRAVNLSNMQVNRKLKALTGRTPSQFMRSVRLQKAMELLETTDLNISEIAYQVGFNTPSYFSRVFSEEFGYAPNTIRK